MRWFVEMEEFEGFEGVVCPTCFSGEKHDAEGYGLVIRATATRIEYLPTGRYNEHGERLYKVVKEPLGSRRFMVYIDKFNEPVAVMINDQNAPEGVPVRGMEVFSIIGAALAVASKTAPPCTGACRSGHPHEEAIRALLPE